MPSPAPLPAHHLRRHARNHPQHQPAPTCVRYVDRMPGREPVGWDGRELLRSDSNERGRPYAKGQDLPGPGGGWEVAGEALQRPYTHRVGLGTIEKTPGHPFHGSNAPSTCARGAT